MGGVKEVPYYGPMNIRYYHPNLIAKTTWHQGFVYPWSRLCECLILNIYSSSCYNCIFAGVYFLMVLMYGLCSIPFVYIFSYFRRTSAGAFNLLSIINILTGKYCIIYEPIILNEARPTDDYTVE
jgi:hypothetical protein